MEQWDSIILLDAYFPYEGAETFLENEISYLKQHCKKLYIIPIYAQDCTKSRVSQKDNVVVYPYSLNLNTNAKICAAVSATFSKDFWAEICLLISQKKLNVTTLYALIQYVAQGRRKTRLISKWLSDQIPSDSKVLFYAYWLDNNAYIAGFLKAKYPYASVISRGHRFDVYSERHPFAYFPCREVTLKKLDRVYLISQHGKDYIDHNFSQWTQGKTYLSYLGTKEHGLNPENKGSALRIVSCSNMVPVKRIHMLVHALSLIQDLQIFWTHFGDGECREDLVKLASDCLQHNIQWQFAGHMQNSELMDIYSHESIDLFVNVSASEGLPVSIMEAMSFGIPAIATNVGGTSEIVQSGVNGFLMKEDFMPQELADLICKFANYDGKSKKEMRKNARQTWEEKFNADVNYRKFYKELDMILDTY